MKGNACKVIDEQGSEISKREIVRIITKRHHHRGRVDGIRIIDHGKGTWDLVTDKFFNQKRGIKND